MTISSTINRVSYAGNGSTTSFSFPYRFLLNSDLVVISKNNSTGVETILVLNTGYTVSGAGSPAGGSVTITPAPATGTTVIIYRDPAIKQEVDFLDNDKLPAEVLEGALDRATMVSQRLSDRIGRALVLPEGFTGTFDPKLPSTLTPDATIAISPTGDKLVMGPSATDVANAQGYANAAASSASAAAGSAAAAAASAAASASVASDLATETANRISADASHASTASGIHGVTGALVGTSDAQTLSAKTFADPVSLTEVATPAAPTSGVRKLYAKSGKIYHMGSDGLEQAVGAGSAGGVNYISNPDAESSTLGWTTYADAAGAAPVDGVGGTPSATWTRVTASPLRGSASFLFTKGAVNRQGDGASFAFSVDAADKAKVLQISFDYAIDSGTFADGDLTVWIYDVTNASLTQPAPYRILNASAGLASKWSGAFQTASNSTSYRLILHVASTSASAYTVKCDNFAVSPQVITQGTPVTDWTSYTPTFAGLGTVTGIDFKWRRVGDSIQILGAATTGTTTGSTASFTLPSGLSNNLATTFKVGTYGRVNANAEQHAVITQAPDKTKLYFGVQTGTQADLFTRNGNEILSGEYFTVVTEAFPVQGWSSQVQMSSDTDTRVVAMKAYQASHHTLATGVATKINFNTTTLDTHGAFDTANNKYVVKVSGVYKIYAKLLFDTSSSGTRTVQIFKNSTRIAEEQHPATGYTYISVATVVDASAGDSFEVKGMQDSGGNLSCGFDGGDQTQCAFEVERLSGPSQIAASETVSARYSFSGTQTLTGGNDVVDFATKDFDTNGSVTGNGSGINGTWKFTAPVSGQYEMYIMCDFEQTNSTSNTSSAQVGGIKNSTASRFTNFRYTLSGQTTGFSIVGKRTYQLLAGETLKAYALSNASGPSLSAGYIEIRRVGNY